MDYSVYTNGHLKSGLQKAVRRGMAEEAAAVAIVLARRGMPFFKRLPVIAAEDVGWEFVAPVFNACREATGDIGLSGQPQDQQLRVAAKLARALTQLPKDRDCSGLASLGALANEKERISPEISGLRAALEAGDVMLAMRHCERFAAERQRRLVWDLFRIMAYAKPCAIQAHVEGIRGASYRGVLPFDELILMAAAIFSLTGRKSERSFDWKAVSGAVVEPKDWLPWHVFDMHTREGCEARAELQRQGLDASHLTECWWHWESALVDQEIGQYAAEERRARGFGDETQAEWVAYRQLIRSLVEDTLHRRGLPFQGNFFGG